MDFQVCFSRDLAPASMLANRMEWMNKPIVTHSLTHLLVQTHGRPTLFSGPPQQRCPSSNLPDGLPPSLRILLQCSLSLTLQVSVPSSQTQLLPSCNAHCRGLERGSQPRWPLPGPFRAAGWAAFVPCHQRQYHLVVAGIASVLAALAGVAAATRLRDPSR